MVLAAHEFMAEANECFAQAERLDPREPRWPYYQGVALTLGSPEAALPKLQRAVELWGEGSEAPRLRLAEVLLGQGHLDEAAILFLAVLQRNEANARAHLGLGRVAYLRGDLEASVRHLDLARADARVRKAAYLLLAENHQRRGDQAAADEASQEADALPEDPPWPDPLVEEVAQLRTGRQAALELAEKRLRHGQVAEAAALLERTTRAYPESDWGWYLLGKAHVLQKDWAAAEQALRRAARLTPHAPEIQFHLGVALFQQQDLRSAAACFRRATELKPDYALAHYNLGQCLHLAGDRESTREALRAAVRSQPDLADARIFLAELLIGDGQYAEALVHLRQASEIAPEDPKLKRVLGQLLKQIAVSIRPW
jgi:tetratricopeptide (TPR) repeat protein